jgi:hypothetical protein
MRFTEHELTTALTGTAKQLLAVQRKEVRKGRVDIETVWEATDRYERFKLLDALGDQLFPVLGALPDVEVVPGTRPTFTDEQVMDAVDRCLGEVGGRLRRKAVLSTRVAVVRMALQHLPPRSGPRDQPGS